MRESRERPRPPRPRLMKTAQSWPVNKQAWTDKSLWGSLAEGVAEEAQVGPNELRSAETMR